MFIPPGHFTKVNDKLRDLETSNPFLPPDSNSTCALEVVPVHHDVHQKVKTDGDPGHRSQPDELGVAKKCRGAMMVAV